jgi:PAS domain S-box-containing protein
LHDVTELKESQKALEKSERKHREFLKSLPLGIYAIDMSGRFTYMNPHGLQMFGYTEHDLEEGIFTWDLLPQDQSQKSLDNIKSIAKGGKLGVTKYRAVRKDGTVFPIIAYSSALVDDDKVVGVLGVLVDISDRKLWEEEVIESERMLRSILTASPVGIGLTSPDRQLEWVNEAWLRIFGFESENECLGGSTRMLYPSDEEFGRVVNEAYPVIEKDLVADIKVRMVRRDGIPLDAHIRMSALDSSDLSKGIIAAIEDITERKRAEEALQQSEEKFAKVFHYAPVLITLSNVDDGTFLDVNEKFSEVSGFSREEANGKTSVDLGWISREDRIRLIEELQAHGSVRDMDLQLVTKDKRELHCIYNGEFIQTNSRQLLLSIAHDVTERKQAEEAIRESEKRYRSLFENMLDGFAYCKIVFEDGNPSDFIYLDVNDAFERLTGLKNVIGKKVTELIPGIRESNPELFEIYGRVALTGNPEKFEIYLDSLGLWISLSVYSTKREYFVAVFDNITQRKLAEKAVKESGEKYRVLADNMLDVIWQLTPDMVFTYISPSIRKHLGYEAHEVLGRPIWEFIAPDSIEPIRRRVADRFKLLLSNRESFVPEPYESEQTRKDGTTLWTETIASPVFNNESQLIAFQGVTRDITDRKRLQQERLDMERRMRYAQKLESLGVMAGGIAHDFNNILQVVLSNLQLVLKQIESLSPIRMYLNDALKATTRAAKLSSLMLDYTGTRRFIPEEMDLNHLLEKDKDLKSAVPHTVTLEIHKGENLPQICGNPPQIQQVMMSVVTNSVESIADKPGEIRLTTGMMDCDKDYLNSCRHELKAEPGRYVFVEVADTGLGMDAQTDVPQSYKG